MRGVASYYDTSAKPRPWKQQRLHRAVDNFGIRIERARNLGDIAAVLSHALFQQLSELLLIEPSIRRFGANMKDVHEVII